jgi:molecular chaperone DnaK (HSP70)
VTKIEKLHRRVDFRTKISREEFYELSSDLFQHILTPLEHVQKDAGLKRSDITGLVIIGQSTRVKFVRDSLHAYFPE